MRASRQRDILSWCLAVGVQSRPPTERVASLVLWRFWCPACFPPEFGEGRTWVNGGTVNFTTPPSTSLSSSVSHSRSLSLFQLCQTTVSIAVCLPSSKNHLVGILRHTLLYTNTHNFFPRSDTVQEVMILVHCRLIFSGNLFSPKTSDF